MLWRDAEIHALRALLSQPDKRKEIEQQRDQLQQQLIDEFAFIAQLNMGSESVAPSDIARMQQIGQRRWQAHFDGHLGLSHVELARLDGQAFCYQQTLLADKPEHRIPHDRAPHFAPHLGIKMQRPFHRFNYGELYNLSIPYGTLSQEERYIVNEHIIGTIKMLDGLALPPELANVPHLASTHHETLDGKGYPRGLSATDLSMPERMIILADIFEALTAADRPYKKAKTLTEALDILQMFVEQKRLDKDVFHLFLTGGVYRQYAERFLNPTNPAELDIDITRYL
ncbi:HD-GYP domain-containing protein [Thiomicrospira microaerophila]|uniref:HD-GYP domain-containing protein n=1 Tax=Thiomicrospira microaerophila TaxID=406020 RepID=UPI0005C8C4B2|nr:HD domain-containing phosphohydrolase [Thiomicrospira microaerophila]